MDFTNVLERISERGNRIKDGDYIKDGLYHCSVCKEPKQCRINAPAAGGRTREMVVNCICKCRQDELAAEERKEAEHHKQQIRADAFPSDKMQEWTFENDDGTNEKLTEGLKKFVDNFTSFSAIGKGLLLYGNTGTGKSYGAAEVVNALIDKGYRCRFTSCIDIVHEMQAEWGSDAIDELCECDLVVLDDFSAERKTEYMQENVYSIIDALSKEKVPVIVTTNLSKEQLKGATDITFQRTYSRIAEMCHPVLVDGADRRKKKATDTYKATKELLGI